MVWLKDVALEHGLEGKILRQLTVKFASIEADHANVIENPKCPTS